ncbi:SRPBCC family protein [Rhodococcus aetherivorans]|uniref:SRPBCC family protein n=1 Tax=Rhodococcus aetherivorans TaxID=191292 RepID=A0AA46SCY1_9NOCA|nr:SRPBCC family protein [Rhodococcus aetherivorans]MDV6294400.1 SRPBCC family protein [Rhodococcus aetherivorans]UYF93184.1 SRPBCC family protein [Rhodococcus aetherivorans]WFS13027.1 SRPBCC family protein [Rhodococcus aetherivorans]
MAKLEVSTDLPLEPHVTWVRASDLHGFDEWLTIHDGWRSDLPSELVVGTTAESVVSVKGMRNRVAWTVREIGSPHHLVLHGSGKGGTRFKLRMTVRAAGIGSVLSLNIDLGGAPLFGPIGSGVARALHGDIEASLRRFAELYS